MNSAQSPAKQIFLDAIENYAPDEWAEYLDQACGDDTELRRRVETLLEAHGSDASLLNDPAIEFAATVDHVPITETPGTVIGPYKLLEQIGEGGFGVVFMAEQTEPICRHVALKIIKPGMDTRQVVARFEAERQALAMMDHPNIARVLDAGTTDTGRPYFVMELVKGVPITNYCDQHQLTLRERLELFSPVCQAVQHAHQKGIIHRDLKPSNVLVAHYDDRPVPKVIDFGVAKATGERLTEKTMFTQFGQVVGTVDYMSPEQARLNQWDVDTRSDIYSLGVLLYELVTGETPFDRQRLRSAAFDELLRIIREEEPPRPSTRLSGSKTLASTAANRRTEPQKLSGAVRGELDWIVMRAMEKDGTRRDETASQLTEDIKNHLQGDTVVACPPSARFRFRKFLRRNKAAIATMAVIAIALLVGGGVATWQAVLAAKERDRAILAEAAAAEQAQRADAEAQCANREAEKARAEANIAKAVNDFLNKDLLAEADPFELPEQDVKLRDVLDLASDKVEGRFSDQPLIEAAIHQTLADTYGSIGEHKQSEKHNRLAMEIRLRVLGEGDPNTLQTMLSYAGALYRLGRRADSEHMARKVVEISIRELGPENKLLADAHNQIALGLHRQGLLEEAKEHYRKSIDYSERINGKKDFVTMTNLAIATGRNEQSVQLFREALEIAKSELGEDHISLANTMYWLANALGPDSEEAVELHRKVLDMRLRVLGPTHPHTLSSRSYLTWIAGRRFAAAGSTDEAIAKYTEAVKLQPHGMHFYYEDRGRVYAAMEEWEKAVADYGRAIEEFPAALPWICEHRAAANVQLQKWGEAADDLMVSVDRRPEDPLAWLRLAPVLVLSGNEAAYESFCHRLIKAYEDGPHTSFADIVCKACMLRPGVVSFDRLPIKVLDKVLAEGTANYSHEPWYWGTKAIVAYRSGEHELALEFVENSQANNPDEHARPLNLAVRSMALHQLQREGEATQALQDAANVIAQLKLNEEYREAQPLLRDLLIAQILYAEAEALIGATFKSEDALRKSTAEPSLNKTAD